MAEGPAHAEPTGGPSGPAEARLAARLSALGGPARQRLASALRQLAAVDGAVYDAVASVPTPDLDVAFRRLSKAADQSRLWVGIAAALALAGGPAGRRAALRGTIAVGVTSALVNAGLKTFSGRDRPDRAGAQVPDARHVRMPTSGSFPSGHSASAFAFASAIGRDMPWTAMGLRFVAGAVAYSRIHTGVHYPGDTVIGAIIGAGAGQAVAAALDRRRPARPAAG